jgi:CRISPR-associated protein Csx10
MKILSVNLDVISPLAVRSDHAASRTANSKYIPGNTLLGSLATIHRVLRPERTEEFEQFFLSGQVLYSNLHPSRFESKETRKEKGWVAQGSVYPLPKTALTCKRHKGFPSVGSEKGDGHGVRDSLVDWALFKLGASYPSLPRLDALRSNKVCHFKDEDKECPELLDHIEGYYRHYHHSISKQARTVQTKNSSRLQTHTGIDRESGTVREGILYNREVFEEGSKFWGEIHLLVDKDFAAFNSFLWEVKRSELLRLGTGRTRGMGKVAINFEAKEGDDVKDRRADFDDRTEGLNKLIHDQALGPMKDTKDIEKLNNQFFFALTLHSPVILTDEFLRYHSCIDEEVLCECFDITCDQQKEPTNAYNLKSVYSNFSNKRITGWQELWGTPRTNEYAIDTGSVFLFQCDEGKRGKVLDALFNLEEMGIGNRRAEGFGRICVSDPFHLRSEQKQWQKR